MKHEKILLSHGSGGKLMHELIKELFINNTSSAELKQMDDAAVLNLKSFTKNSTQKLVFTTDAFVVNPLFFPGGDIGKLAICGTVNDLSMMGAVPKFVAVSAIIEEGFEIDKLRRITQSLLKTSDNAGIKIVAGDTKVVEHSKGDGIFLTTSGIGVADKNINISGHNAKPGDVVIINGTIGEHEIAVLNARDSFGFKTKLKSDCAPLNGLVKKMVEASNKIHVLRDPTRGGLATTLNEISEQSNVNILVHENKIPMKQEARQICAMLGLDPLYLANEGKLVAIVSRKDADKVLRQMKNHSLGKNSAIIGEVVRTKKFPQLFLKTKVGGTRILLMLEGEQLPRIC